MQVGFLSGIVLRSATLRALGAGGPVFTGHSRLPK